MKIIVTDGYVENPGDLSWAPLEALGEVTYYDRIGLTDEDETIRRIGDAEIAVINKAPVTRKVIDSCPNLKLITVLATGYNVVDVAYAKEKGMFVIIDGKRNDIGTTMEAYAAAHLGKVQVGSQTYEPFLGDALTVNGYLGSDGIKPLVATCRDNDKGIFVLVKTSNPSSGELQDKKIDGVTIYETMGHMCEEWGKELPGVYGYSGVGAVVGATYPEQLKYLREKLPTTFFLIPGYGAQGAGAKDIAGAFDKNGLGGIVNSSRGIMCAYQKEKCDEHEFAEAARREAIRMRDEIMGIVGKISISK